MIPQNDLAVLSNFLKVSNQIFISKGNIIRTKTQDSNDTFAIAKLEYEFPLGFAIADLGTFINILKANKDYELEFKPSEVHIKTKNSTLKYKYSGDFKIPEIPIPNIPDGNISFSLSNEDLKKLKKYSSILQLKYLRFEYDDFIKKIRLTLTTKNEDSANSFELIIDDFEYPEKKSFTNVLNFDMINVLDMDYSIDIAEGKFIHFKCDSELVDVNYYYSFRQIV